MYRALVLLVISCPCALVISTPVSIVAALSAAARNGVLIKGGAYLEKLAEVRQIAFDKTGTLTTGKLWVAGVTPFGDVSARDVLRFAAAVESRSEHPVGRAIVNHAAAEGMEVPAVAWFASTAGMGAEGDVGGAHVVVGNERLLAAHGVELNGADAVSTIRQAGQSLTFVVVNGRAIGAIAVADRPREAAKEAIEMLRSHGIERVIMLTGDHPQTAEAVARMLDVDEHHAALLPEQKHDLVRTIRQRGAVMMVGDGVNDAPALAAADVGVAMGAAGSDAALETADVALMSDELLKLPYALRLARATVRNVKTNVVVSLVLKAVFLVMAITGSATLWMAVLADSGASVIVVANALRLLRTR
jgi:Cd2+/Zn2+-exporting ATPase